MLHIARFLAFIGLLTLINAWCEFSKFNAMGAVTCVDYSPDASMIVTTTLTQVTVW